MKILFLSLAALLLVPATLSATGQQVRFALAMHSEVKGGGTGGIPVTPDFTSSSTPKLTYVQWREALINFARQCSDRSIPWQFQSDYNFLEGVYRYEVFGRSGFDSTIANGSYTDSSLTAYTYGGVPNTTNTGGKNVIKYLHENLGVNLDPHSHESNSTYNYADVAWLIDIACDTEVTGVVGGHVYVPTSPTKYQNWPKFIGGLTAVNSAHGGYVWRPHLLMGASGETHRDDPHVSGLWRPQDANNFFTDSATGGIAAIGTWEQDFFETDKLLRSLEDNTLPHNNKLWTCGRVVNHRDLVLPNYLQTTVPAILETIRQWRDAGRFQVKTFEDIYTEWLSSPYSGQSSVYLRPIDNMSFSLNWQDFCYKTQSNNELRTLLNHHENMRVPVDVFLTTWQTDSLEQDAPQLLGRLFSSRWVNTAYHIRAPKPYASGVNWRTYTSADVTTYESSQLSLTSGQPVTGVSGGFAKLTNLYGSAPRLVGPNSDINSKATVYPYFGGAGVRMIVQHDDNAAVNFGTPAVVGSTSLNVRPESYDWRLIETYDPSRATQPVSNTLDEALGNARTASGATSPYFTNVKLHDNDLFANESAWVAIYVNSKPNKKPDWVIDNPDLWAGQLSRSESERRRSFYTGVVTQVAGRRTSINTMDGRDILSMLGEEASRPIGLSKTEILEGAAIRSAIAEITGGGVESGLRCTYQLVSGSGSDDNADFSISGSNLLAARTLSSTQPVRHLRIRWTDGGANSAERALTVVIAKADDDGDGFTEEQEIAAGTDPRDPLSRLSVTISGLSGSNFTVTWASVIGKTYHVDYSSNLSTWTTVSGSSRTATAATTSLTVSGVSGARLFFRVVAE
jgi:hypothetical protein